MCLGLPMRVLLIQPSGAVQCAAEGDPQLRTVEPSLLDRPPRVGDWLLVHADVAVRALEIAEARQITDALQAVAAAAAGEPFEHLLSDLIDREPQLPAHLQDQARGATEHG